MRRYALLILSIMAFVIPVYSQIQNRFFGYMFGSRMYHMEDAMKDYMCTRQIDDLTALNIDFGGLTWDYVEMGYVNDKFCDIRFHKIFRQKDSASGFFLHLKEKLDSKYSYYKILSSCNSKTVLYDDSKNVCMLTYEYSESKGGDIFWYLNLYYWNLNLNNERMSKYDNEL